VNHADTEEHLKKVREHYHELKNISVSVENINCRVAKIFI